MKKLNLILTFMLALTQIHAQQTDMTLFIKQGQEMLNNMSHQKYEVAAAMFDESVSKQVNAALLQKTWEPIIAKTGELKKVRTPRTDKMGNLILVYIPCEFENSTLDFKVMFKPNLKCVGFTFGEHREAQSWSMPDYADKSKLAEKDIKVVTGQFKMPGEFVYPKMGDKKFPVVILVHGSGPNDMDENIYANKPFKDLAYGLASKGIGVIRYDKRTKTYASRIAERTNLTLENETIQDALSAVRLAHQLPGVDTNRIFVIGHSLGAMAAPRIATYAGKDLAGIVIMAGPARPLEDLILEQNIYLSADNPSDKTAKDLKNLQKQVDMVKSGALSPMTPSEQLPLGAPAPYWIYLNQYHQTDVAQKLQAPILVLQGERDYQVTMVDFGIWKKALADSKTTTLKSYPKLNHLFMEGEGAKSKPDEYEIASHIPDYVINDIAEWVQNVH